MAKTEYERIRNSVPDRFEYGMAVAPEVVFHPLPDLVIYRAPATYWVEAHRMAQVKSHCVHTMRLR